MRRQIVGKRFGKLVVTEQSGATCKVDCDCGTKGKTISYLYNLPSGKITSCGCIQREARRVASKHGEKRKGSITTEYEIWSGMLKRCLNPNCKAFPAYGGRGITVAPEWRDYLSFLHDVGRRPSPRHQLDRIDNDGNYEPGNVAWNTSKQNNRHRRDSRLITVNGKTATIAEWAESVGMSYWKLYQRIVRDGWTPERAVSHAA